MTHADAESVLLEIGAGTGQIGEHLLQLPVRYIGVDLSGQMLQVFRERVSPVVPQLIQLDANRRWPVENGSTSVVFSSRTLHLLDREHVVQEFFRVAAPAGAVLISGRARRDPTSVQAEMRQRMRQLLREVGVEGRASERNLQAMFDACCAAGARRIEPRVAHRWVVERSPLRSIEAWQGKDGLAGIAVSAESKRVVFGAAARVGRRALWRFCCGPSRCRKSMCWKAFKCRELRMRHGLFASRLFVS